MSDSKGSISEVRVNVLGVGVSPITLAEAMGAADDWIARRQQHYVCVTTAHGVMESQGNETLRHIHNRSGLTVPDGMPLVWLCRRAGYPATERVYGPTLLLALCGHGVPHGYRHFFYGGVEGVASALAGRLHQRFPGLQVCGVYSPPFRALTPDEDTRIVEMINTARPDVVWVGLGTPKQEWWMAGKLGRLEAPVLIGVGAAFDFHTGRVPQAPVWMQTRGLEWAFRLAQEPRRLWRRYLLGNPRFLFHLFLQYSGLRSYPLEVCTRVTWEGRRPGGGWQTHPYDGGSDG